MMSDPIPIYENEKYGVYTTDNALGEDGQYGREGYAVINKETNVIEHTTIVLPQALFQADALMGALGHLDAVADAVEDSTQTLLTDEVIDPTDVLN